MTVGATAADTASGKREVIEQPSGSAIARNGAIDVLRGWAVCSVILLHLNIRVPFGDSWLGRSLPRPLSKWLFWSGYPAVMVFFVISGFLITSTSLARWGELGRMHVAGFYRLRFARIAPALVLFVLVQSVLQTTGVAGFSDPKPAAPLATTIFSVFTFHLNWLEAKVGYLPGAWDVLWSLCVEELFYFGFPLVARFARARLAFPALLLAFVVAGPFARVASGSNDMWKDHSYLSCMGEIALGCLAALLARRYAPSRGAARVLLIVGLALMAFILYFRRAVNALGLYDVGLDVTVLSFGTAAFLVAVSAPSGWKSHALTAPLRWLGKHSYEVYLSHLFVILPATLLWKRWGNPALIPVFYVGMIAASALLGGLVASGVSKPCERRLRAAPPVRSAA